MEDTQIKPLPEGDYAIVEVLGHRTMVGRIAEVERFGTKFLAIEPLFEEQLLPEVLVGGSSVYQLTPCTAEVARKQSPKRRYQLPASIQLTLPDEPLEALPSFITGDDDEEGPF